MSLTLKNDRFEQFGPDQWTVNSILFKDSSEIIAVFTIMNTFSNQILLFLYAISYIRLSLLSINISWQKSIWNTVEILVDLNIRTHVQENCKRFEGCKIIGVITSSIISKISSRVSIEPIAWIELLWSFIVRFPIWIYLLNLYHFYRYIDQKFTFHYRNNR